MQAVGQLCTIGILPNLTRLFYYGIVQGLHLEIIDRRHRDMKHLVLLVDPQGNPVPIPKGSRFIHVRSEEAQNLLENHLREHANP